MSLFSSPFSADLALAARMARTLDAVFPSPSQPRNSEPAPETEAEPETDPDSLPDLGPDSPPWSEPKLVDEDYYVVCSTGFQPAGSVMRRIVEEIA